MIVDLFAGPGGWDEGARLAGYTGPLVGIEHDQDACHTAVQAGHWRVRADVAHYPSAPFRNVEGLIASPPCPTFSSAGNGAGKLDMDKVHDRIRAFANGRKPAEVEWEDERSRLTAEPMRWAHALQPRWIACEQVPAVLPLWQHTAMLLRGLGYKTWTGVLSSEEYGVPQTRKRAILIARCDSLPALPPEPTHQAYRAGRDVQLEDDLFGSPLPPPVSMAEALGWGRQAPTWTVTNAVGRGLTGGGGTRQAMRHEVGRGVWVVRTGNNSKIGGGETKEFERDTASPSPTLTGNVNRWQVALQSNYGTGGDPRDKGERTPDQPAATVTSKIDRAKWVETRPATTVCGDARIGRPGHKDRDKGEAQFAEDSVRVSVREAGILQSFRADYPWQGTSTKQYLQVGNAVPPRLAAAILEPLVTEPAQWVPAQDTAEVDERVAS
jgi:DNA (cytosine-5)-methyltransferase 1